MKHVGTICTHCSNGCKTTLGVRNNEIIRGNNRDRTGINGEFLCIKGRYAFDFIEHPDRLTTPLRQGKAGFEPVPWAEALAVGGRALPRGQGAGRRLRRRGLGPRLQRGEFLPAEVRPAGAGDE